MIITISREYGALGHTIAGELAQRLGVEYYDKDLVKLTAQVSGYSVEDIEREGEDMSNRARWINNLLDNMASYTSSYDRIYEAQRALVLELAKKPGIIVGRCANIILQEAGIESFNIFLYADREHKLQRTMELGEYGQQDPEKFMERRDHLRRVYYKAYTNHEFGDYRDYNICLDTGVIGKERCVDILESILKDRVGN